jgi:hypothetical protein
MLKKVQSGGNWPLKNIKQSEMWQASGEGMYHSTFLNH